MIATDRYQLKGITSFTTYPSGEMRDCKINEYNEISVGSGMYVPRYKAPDERRKDNKAISFYENGNIKSIALEERTKVATSLGTILTELLTFYEDGSIDSLFPLNGQLSYGWSEKDEETLLEDMRFDLPIGWFTTKIIGLRFYQNGVLKSLILWPKKTVEINTPFGVQNVRIGFRLYEDGSLESFEPAYPLTIETRIGSIIAFDQNAVGIDADFNSVRFYPDGSLQCISTNSDIVVNKISERKRTMIFQQLRLDMVSDEMVKLPIVIRFNNDEVMIDNGAEIYNFPIEDSNFLFLYDGSYQQKKCSPGSDCSDCGASCM